MDGVGESEGLPVQGDRGNARRPALFPNQETSAVGRALSYPAGLQAADGFAIRLQPGGTPGYNRTVNRLAPLLAAGKKLTIDLSQQAVTSATDDATLPAELTSLSRSLAARGLDMESVALVFPCGHPFIAGCDWQRHVESERMVIRIDDDFMRAVQLDRDVREPASAQRRFSGRRSARRIWWSWLAQLEQDSGPGLFIEHDSHKASSAGDGRFSSVSWPLLIKAPDYGAQLIFELDLTALSLNQLWKPGRLAHELVRLADSLIETTRWPSAMLTLDASQHRQVVLWLRGTRSLSQRLSRCPATASRRLGELIEGLKRRLWLVSRRKYCEGSSSGGAPGWVADIRCPKLREQVSTSMTTSAVRRGIYLAMSPWDLIPEDFSGYPTAAANLFPALRNADLLVWRPPATLSLSKEKLDLMLRMAWAAKNR